MFSVGTCNTLNLDGEHFKLDTISYRINVKRMYIYDKACIQIMISIFIDLLINLNKTLVNKFIPYRLCAGGRLL